MKKTKNNGIKTAVILTAAGSSTRMGNGKKKEFLPLEDGTVLSTSCRAFLNSSAIEIAAIIVTHPKEKKTETENALFSSSFVLKTIQTENIPVIFTEGGQSRQQSVLNALLCIEQNALNPEIVLIHDAARPWVSEDVINDTASKALEYGAAVPAVKAVDTLAKADENGFIEGYIDREKTYGLQTPQGFIFDKLLAAHKKAAQSAEFTCTDDTSVWAACYGPVFLAAGSTKNKKITFKDDISDGGTGMEIRTGLGYDLHRLVEGRPLILGGVTIPFEKGEDGHSDGDLLLHAITDALLGAAHAGDIGEMFPPSDPKWKDADSSKLLQAAWERVKAGGWKLENLDCVIALEKPKFLPYRQEICRKIAETLGCPSDRVFVKAKTGEKLGEIGRGEAAACWATCLLSRNNQE